MIPQRKYYTDTAITKGLRTVLDEKRTNDALNLFRNEDGCSLVYIDLEDVALNPSSYEEDYVWAVSQLKLIGIKKKEIQIIFED